MWIFSLMTRPFGKTILDLFMVLSWQIHVHSNPSASNVPILTHALKTPMSLNRFNIDVYTIGLERR